MAVEQLARPEQGARRVERPRPGGGAVVATLAAHGVKAFARNPVALFFTLAMPVGFLLIINAIYGNEVVEFRGGIRLAQYYTPAMAVFGAVEAAFCTLAVDTALLRERGILKRLRSTPAPAWAVLAGRVVAAVVVAFGAAAAVFAVGVLALGVHVVWRMAAAAVVTLIVGIGSFAALGLAVVAVVRGSGAAQAVTNGLLLPLAFISDVFALTPHMPVWLERLGSALPLKHFANALGDTFNSAHSGSGFSAGHLTVLAGWGLAGAAFAAWRLRWEPVAGGAAAVDEPVRDGGGALPRVLDRGRPPVASLLRTQAWYAFTGLYRDPASAFFSVVFPVLLIGLFPVLMGDTPAQHVEGARLMLPGLAAYGIAIVGYATMPATVAQARERGVLKRLRGTPMPIWSYVVGRLIAALVTSLITLTLLVAVAMAGFGVRIPAVRGPAALVTILLSVACFAALGLALLTFVRRAQTAIALSLGTLLPVGFISGVFIVGADLPGPLRIIGDVLPLKHASQALSRAVATGAGGAGFAWADLAILVAWLVAGLLVARRLAWEP